jgi:mannose-1-phosphate guanylyltransferase/mannose-6-phosphate isomerase
MKKHIIILAGGAGTRLWPASQGAYPKQFLDFDTGISLYQRTLQRALLLEDFESILIVTHQGHVRRIIEQSILILSKRTTSAKIYILPEPAAKNTAPALVYACVFLQSLGQEDSLLVVLPADHLIEPIKAFQTDIKKALTLAASDFLVTFGIPPQKPDTGYGYIKTGDSLQNGYHVLEFTEKPNITRARYFLKQGNYFWNSGMFTFKQELFMRELMIFGAEIAKPFLAASLRLSFRKQGTLTILSIPAELKRAYIKIPKISIDNALMEKSKKRAVVKATFRWSDVGSWDEVASKFKTHHKQLFITESKDNYVFSDLPVALVGVDNLNVIVKNNIVLICKKGNSQLVKKTVNQIDEKDFIDLL